MPTLKNLETELYMKLQKSDAGKNIVEYIKKIIAQTPSIILGYADFITLFPNDATQLLTLKNVLIDNIQHDSQVIKRFIEKDFNLIYLSYSVFPLDQSPYYRNNLEEKAVSIFYPLQYIASDLYRHQTRHDVKVILQDIKPKISHIILSGLNNADSLKHTLESYTKTTSSENHKEVIVVLNESEHNSGPMAAKILSGYNYKIIFLKNNRHATGGWNTGIKHAEGKYITLIQDDVMFTQKNWDEELAYYLDKYPYIGVIGGFRGLYIFKEDSPHHSDDLLTPPYKPLATAITGSNDYPAMKKHLVEFDTTSCMCMMFRKEIGLIDWEFYPCGLDDISLCYKAHEMKYNIYCTDVGIQHMPTSIKRQNDDPITPIHKKIEKRLISRNTRALHFSEIIRQYGHLMRTSSFKQINNIKTIQDMETFVHKLPRDYPEKNR